MFNNIEQAIKDIKNGKIVIVIDSKDRENEGDLIVAAQFANTKKINFMISEAKGLLCVPISIEKANQLDLKPMVNNNTENQKTAFTVSIDYKTTTTGISASDRALTIKQLANPNNTILSSDFCRPGHVFPLIAESGGLLKRQGHTEAAIDLMKLANLEPAAAIIEIINEDGTMARRADLNKFSKKHNLTMISIENLKNYIENQNIIECVSKVKMPTEYGNFDLYTFIDKRNGESHIALTKGTINNKENVLSRIHSECLTGDLFRSKRCDCGDQLRKALININNNENGILIYLRQEGRGIGLINKIKTYELQEQGYDTVDSNIMIGFEPDLRTYEVAANIYKYFNVKSVDLMTNNPDKVNGLEKNGIKVNERIAIEIKTNDTNKFYMKTKKERMNHILNF